MDLPPFPFPALWTAIDLSQSGDSTEGQLVGSGHSRHLANDLLERAISMKALM